MFAAAKEADDEKTAVEWLEDNPPTSCYSEFHAELLTFYKQEIEVMKALIAWGLAPDNLSLKAAYLAAVNIAKPMVDSVNVDRQIAAAACSLETPEPAEEST